MKKNWYLFLALSLLLTTVGCGTDIKEPVESNNNVESEKESTINSEINEPNTNSSETPVVEVTMQDLENAPESPASDFDYFNTDNGVVIKYYTGNEAIVVIPNEIDGKPVVKITWGAFINKEAVQAIRVGDNVVDCGDGKGAFANCYNLKYVILGKNVETLDAYCFNATSLVEIRLNDKLKTIGDLAFAACNMPKIHIPASVEKIGEAVFHDDTIVYVKAGSYAEEYMKAYVEQWKGSQYVIE